MAVGPLLVALASGCTVRSPAAVEAPAPDPLPTIRVEQPPDVTGVDRRGRAGASGAVGDRVWAPGGETPVHLTAVGADVRWLLLALAEQAGLSLVFGPEVRGEISVRLDGVPALEALGIVLREAGLEVAMPLASPWGPTVFYPLAVNVDEAGPDLLRERFGVSRELARWIVESRVR